MKRKFKIGSIIAISIACQFLGFTSSWAQDQAALPAEPVKNTFENGVVINNHTVEVLSPKSIDATIQHRFGSILNADGNLDGENLLGLYSPSNIRLGVAYGVIKNLNVGVGATKLKHIYDVWGKYKILQQMTQGMPISLTYFGDIAMNSSKGEIMKSMDGQIKFANRLSYFNELMVAYKYNSKIALQLSFSYTHANMVDSANFKGIKHNSMAVSFVGKYKFSPQSSILLQFNQPLSTRNFTNVSSNTSGNVTTLTTNKGVLPKPDLGIGFEVSTGSHQFQIFLCTADAIIHQESALYNSNDFLQKQMVIGFNITRQWGF